MILLLGVLLLTSAGAVFIGVRYFALRPRAIRPAIGLLAECVGLAVTFLLLNVGVASLVVVISRLVGVGFVSAYLAGDAVMLVFSCLQATVFQLWRISTAVNRRDD